MEGVNILIGLGLIAMLLLAIFILVAYIQATKDDGNFQLPMEKSYEKTEREPFKTPAKARMGL